MPEEAEKEEAEKGEEEDEAINPEDVEGELVIYTSMYPFVADFLGKVDFFKGIVENGRIVFPEMGGQSIAYDGPHTGRVYVAVRPENIRFSEIGDFSGKLETQYYLGDVDDCRVQVGETLVRVITDGFAYKSMREGQDVCLSVREFIVFEDDGSLEEMLRIKT